MSDKLLQDIKLVMLSFDQGRLKSLPALVRQLCDPGELFTRLDLTDDESVRLTADPKWMEAIYDNLADTYGEEVDQVDEAIDDSHVGQVGRDFIELLLPGLPPSLRELSTLSELSPIADSAVAVLKKHADVIAAGAIGNRLAHVGFRPIVFQQAMDGVSTLIDDLLQDKKLKVRAGEPIRLYCRHVDPLPEDGIGFQEAAIEVSLTTSLDKLASPEDERRYKRIEDIPIPRSLWLMRWLKEASLTKPLLFPGYRAKSDQADLLLIPDQRGLPRNERWSTVAPSSDTVRRESFAGGKV